MFWHEDGPVTPYSDAGFKNLPTFTSIPQFTGMVNAKELYHLLNNDVEFKKEYKTLDLIIDWCKEKSIKWPNGEITKQIIVRTINGTKKLRTYLIKDLSLPLVAEQSNIKRKISEMTEGELGKCFGTFNYTYMNWEHIKNREDLKKDQGCVGVDRNKKQTSNYY